jgi:hypothetical protein
LMTLEGIGIFIINININHIIYILTDPH